MDCPWSESTASAGNTNASLSSNRRTLAGDRLVRRFRRCRIRWPLSTSESRSADVMMTQDPPSEEAYISDTYPSESSSLGSGEDKGISYRMGSTLRPPVSCSSSSSTTSWSAHQGSSSSNVWSSQTRRHRYVCHCQSRGVMGNTKSRIRYLRLRRPSRASSLGEPSLGTPPEFPWRCGRTSTWSTPCSLKSVGRECCRREETLLA